MITVLGENCYSFMHFGLMYHEEEAECDYGGAIHFKCLSAISEEIVINKQNKQTKNVGGFPHSFYYQ